MVRIALSAAALAGLWPDLMCQIQSCRWVKSMPAKVQSAIGSQPIVKKALTMDVYLSVTVDTHCRVKWHDLAVRCTSLTGFLRLSPALACAMLVISPIQAAIAQESGLRGTVKETPAETSPLVKKKKKKKLPNSNAVSRKSRWPAMNQLNLIQNAQSR